MKRKNITQKTQARVLLNSRRRCCICFGLNRDTSIKQGQIAHLDSDPSNNKEDNLAFLCFDHHDQYDSTTRQSKNFTKLEVLQFREELIESIKSAFSGHIKFGEAEAGIVDKISGHYIRSGEYESADLMVEHMSDGNYHIHGAALWGLTRKYGPNVGTLDFVAPLIENTIEFKSNHSKKEPYRVLLKFGNDSMEVEEENWGGMFGMNVRFEGEYQKAT